MSSLLPARRALLVAALAAVASACGGADSIGGPTTVPVASVTLVAPASLAVGQEATITATLADAAGAPLTGRAVSWSSADRAIATISDAGLVTAIAAGTVRITASSEGKSGYADLSIVPRSALVSSVTLDVAQLSLLPGAARQLVATALDANGAPVTGVSFTWSVEGTNGAAVVSATGLVTAQQMGIVKIRATANGKAGEATVSVLGEGDYDLVFDRWELLGPTNRPLVYRLDARTPGAEPFSTLQSTFSSEATPSPDGTRIAYVCDGGTVICVANHDGSDPHVLAPFFTSAFHGSQPAWSPDGQKIAFRGWVDGASPGIFNPTDVWVVNADGSSPVRLTSADSAVDYYESPTWSPKQPDGSYRLAFSHVTRGGDGYMRGGIQSIRADGSDLRTVTAGTSYLDAEPTWSPDGLQIAFMSNHEIIGTYYAWQVYTVRADGTALARRTDDRAEKGNPAWIKRR